MKDPYRVAMQIECQDISYQYPRTDTRVFDHLNCRVTGPGFHALFGQSGLGKTTLARMIAGELTGYFGRIQSGGNTEVLYTHNMERFPGWAGIGDLMASTTPVSGRDRLHALVAAFGIDSVMNSRFSQLSLGQKNRANLIRYLLQEFDLLIMDESLANVDETTRGRIIITLKTLFPEKSFLYISHNMMEIAKFCNQIIVLRSTEKHPQTKVISGQNLMRESGFAMKDLEQTMLEIVHAS
jgi:ABC-type multidrug transport system ATPase subunit